jgi:multidrug resistance protein, MATE family
MSQATFNEELSIADTLNDKALMPRFFRLAAANVLSSLIVPLATIFSTAFLGHLEELHHLAGVSLAGNLLSLLFLLLASLRMCTTGLTAQAVGADDREAVILVLLRNTMLALVFGVLLLVLQYPVQQVGLAWVDAPPAVIAAAIDYFKAYMGSAPAILINYVLFGWFLAQEKNGVILGLSIVSTITNIAFDYLFVVNFHWASFGAGLSASLTQYLLLLIGIGLVLRELKWQEMRGLMQRVWQPTALMQIFSLNGDLVLNNLFFTLALVGFNYAGIRLGITDYSENALLLEIVFLNIFLVEGVGFGLEALSGQCKGKGASEQLMPLIGLAMGTSLVIALGLASVAILFPTVVFKLFTDHVELVGQVSQDVIWLLPVLGLTAIAFILETYFLGLTKGAIVRNVSLASFLLGFLPTSLVAWQLGSNSVLWLSFCLFLVVRIVGFGILLPGTLKGDELLVNEVVAVGEPATS